MKRILTFILGLLAFLPINAQGIDEALLGETPLASLR